MELLCPWPSEPHSGCRGMCISFVPCESQIHLRCTSRSSLPPTPTSYPTDKVPFPSRAVGLECGTEPPSITAVTLYVHNSGILLFVNTLLVLRLKKNELQNETSSNKKAFNNLECITSIRNFAREMTTIYFKYLYKEQTFDNTTCVINIYFTSRTLSFKTLNLGLLWTFLLKRASTSSSDLKFPSPMKQ